jgi:cytosine/adenosine deaminase-related metal-dependent hydrolase
MTEKETRDLASTNAVVGLCPITESSLGDGIFNGTDFHEAGGQFGIGSDSNIHIALWEELATLEYSQRLRDRSRATIATQDRSTGSILFEAATQAGAQAAGRQSGSINEGQFSTDNEFLCNRSGDKLLDSLIFSGRGRTCISDVWSAGRHMVQDGLHIERERIAKQFVKVSKQLGQEI